MSTITIQHELRSGELHQYTYHTIGGQPVNEYMKNWMADKRRRQREAKGIKILPAPQRASDVPDNIKERAKQLRRDGNRYTDIGRELSLSAHVVKTICRSEKI